MNRSVLSAVLIVLCARVLISVDKTDKGTIEKLQVGSETVTIFRSAFYPKRLCA